ncbi:Sec-independent protein translocase protein TatB [Aureimonas sp. D3]|uniref:Sec-independent protein translocase protein TatB n=1 Tax=Aureimonas sp. D3 TaxID=1638164 RepID=UPI0009EB8733|nr:Sec-independent protein translocase protein TatB [Aureimonas sp. D3]
MFDIGGLELLVIAVVLIVVVGPKDLPKMLRTFGRVSSQMRRMAGDFRRQFDEALKEAELEELRQTAKDVRDLDPRNDLRKAMNPIRAVGDEIRSSIKAAAEAPEPKVPSPTQSPVPMESAPVPQPDSAVNGSAYPLTDASSTPIQVRPETSTASESSASRTSVGGIQ